MYGNDFIQFFLGKLTISLFRCINTIFKIKLNNKKFHSMYEENCYISIKMNAFLNGNWIKKGNIF